MYPYIQASSDDHSDTVKANPHSNFCAIAAVLQGLHPCEKISLRNRSKKRKLYHVNKSLWSISVSLIN